MKTSEIAIIITLLMLPLCSYADGNKLLEQCTYAERYMDNTDEIKDPLNMGFCMGLIQGVRNTIQIMNEDSLIEVCFPEGGIKNGQAVRIVTSYLRRNPASLHEDKVALIIVAFMYAYPCK